MSVDRKDGFIMEESQKKDSSAFACIWIMAAVIAFGLFLEGVECLAQGYGLELRTPVQVIKGVYLWLFMPGVVLYVCNRLAEHGLCGKLKWLRRFVVALFTVGLLFVSFVRGTFYAFTSEMVTEKRTEDGYIEGARSNFLSETETLYYEPVFGIFRRSFPGWTAEQLTEKVRERYNEKAELLEEQEDGIYLFRVPDVLTQGENVYFHVSDQYSMYNNYGYQVWVSQMSRFWENRDRAVWLERSGKMTLEDVRDRGTPMTLPELLREWSVDYPYLICSDSPEDISACAADLVDWYLFVREKGQLPYENNREIELMLSWWRVGRGDDSFSFLVYPLEEFAGEEASSQDWAALQKKMESRLTEAFADAEAAWEAHGEGSQGDAALEESSAAAEDILFMEAYAGDYEVECPVGDGQIRYRMVVRDAAAGSRLYSLLKSTDGGETWEMSVSDPFGGQTGMGIDAVFLKEKFGFATLTHGGGDSAELYVTEDGGKTYREAVMEGYTVTLENGYTYNPYDYPQMPYEEDGVIYVRCGQGQDGDYAGGDAAGKALYQSMDGGYTFTFVEVSKENASD